MKAGSWWAWVWPAVLCLPAKAQVDSVALRYANTITATDLMRHLTVLASDAYEGRETGQRGQKMAAEYLREQFRSYGIPPVPGGDTLGVEDGYFQPFVLEVRRPGGVVLTVAGRSYRYMDGMFYFNERLEGELRVQELVVVVATAARPSDLLKGTDLKGRGLLVLQDGRTGEPALEVLSRWTAAAEGAGAATLLFAPAEYEELRFTYNHYLSGTRMRLADADGTNGDKGHRTGLQALLVNDALGDDLLERLGLDHRKVLRKARRRPFVHAGPIELAMNGTPLRSRLVSENVLAYVEGGDRRDELVVVTAHYDHIGKDGDEVYNGADDDGSGTVAVLEMAEAFAKARAEGHGPRRSVLFMPVSAEEKGLLGSLYYSLHPVFSLERTVADLNIDMIGRRDSAHASGAPYVYVIGSDRMSTELHAVNEQANSTYTGLELDYTFNAPDDPNKYYYRSDHYNFARNGVPAIFYFSGVHEDYHGPGDEVDKILPDLLEQRTRLVFHTAWLLANRPERIVVDRPEGGK
ncbi:MAG: M28 family peptidase [Flavobacteriales bacterium]|nr:hypothetical protein [Flavobacteriales bacterium]MCC6576513.1 M28 family peptidase [Flavobacteriales bacterium]NUQ15746.1 M28 family peptidase [Flavobacteriales bacterium]